MSFSLPRFVRRTPPASLALYFAKRAVPLPETLKWDVGPRALAAMLLEAIDALDKANHIQVIADFERVANLCDQFGQTALHSLVASSGNAAFLARLRSADSNETRGIMVLLDDESLFEQADAIAYADRLRNGRKWSAFIAPEPAKAAGGTVELAAFRDDVSAILERFDGTGGKLKIDTFQHRTYDRDWNPVGLAVHHTMYAEGMPEIELQFEGPEPRPYAKRPVHEGAISYDPDRATLDVVSKGGKPVRERAQSYARRILGATDDLQPVRPRSFRLDGLKRPMPLPSDPADHLKSVSITLLRLQDMAGRAGWVTLETDKSDRADIHALSERWFGDADPLRRANWRVTQARLQIVFHPEAGQTRDKTVTIELRAPNGSNLKEQIRHHQIISEKYLARWGLVGQEGA
jgi:hypothetical protein